MNKKQIKQKIQMERGAFENERRKNFLHLKNTGKYDSHFMQRIKKMAKVDSIVRHLNWYQRIYIFIRLMLKRLWRRK